MTRLQAWPPREPTQPGGPGPQWRRRTAPARGTAPSHDGLRAARGQRLLADGSTGGAAPQKGRSRARCSGVLQASEAPSRKNNGRRRTACAQPGGRRGRREAGIPPPDGPDEV
eukprot:2304919-Alexandrium_andersonii.AAC.1